MAWMVILKLAGPKLAKVAVEAIIDQIGGDDATRLKAFLFGEDENAKIEKYLQDIEKQLEEIKETVQATDLRQLFDRYNDAHSRIESLRRAFEVHLNKPVAHPYRQNACRDVLRSEGVLKQGRNMITHLVHPNFPRNKSIIEEYSDLILRNDKNIDVFSYCKKMRALTNHLYINLVGVMALRAICYDEINDKSMAEDVAIDPVEILNVDEHLKETIKLAEKVRALFSHVEETNGLLRFKHYVSNTYLTGHGHGSSSNGEKPFETAPLQPFRNANYAILEGHGNFMPQSVPPHLCPSEGEPQVFVHEAAQWQNRICSDMERYFKSLGWGGGALLAEKLMAGKLEPGLQTKLVPPWLVVMEPALQQWQVVLHQVGSETVVILVHKKSNLALSGVKKDCLYLSPLEKSNKSIWWQPVLTGNELGQVDGNIIMLKHWESRRALDANGKCAYSGNRTADHGNKYMKWIVEEVGKYQS